MQDIDFLPVQYRQRYVRQQSQPWRIVVVVVFAALLAAAALSQHNHKRQAEEELAEITPQHDLAVSRNSQLVKAQSRLQAAWIDAELFTYLRHPWPHTQLLAALLAPLPEEITLRQLQVTRETPQNQATIERRSRAKRKAEEEKNTKLPPAARDLKRLRDEFDKIQTVVLISGTTKESAVLHRYLGELGKNDLFSKAELDSIENVAGNRGEELEFHARLLVRPGYGQPHGPAAPKKDSLARTNRVSR